MMMICYKIDDSNMCLFLYLFMIVNDSAGKLPKSCNNGFITPITPSNTIFVSQV